MGGMRWGRGEMQPRNRRALEATRSTPHKVKQANKQAKQASKKDQDQYAPEGWATTSGRADRYARNRRRVSLSMRMRIMPNANPSASANAMPARPFNWYDGGEGGGLAACGVFGRPVPAQAKAGGE
jgi:hypothetical protein